MIDDRVQIRRFRQHGHIQHGSAALRVEPAAAEIQVIGREAGRNKMGSAVHIQGMISPEAMGKDNQRGRGLSFRQLKHTKDVSVGTLDNNLFHRHLRKNISCKEKENQYYRAQPFSHQITSPELYYKQYTKKLILKT